MKLYCRILAKNVIHRWDTVAGKMRDAHFVTCLSLPIRPSVHLSIHLSTHPPIHSSIFFHLFFFSEVLATPECRSYRTLSESDRAETYSNSNSSECDGDLWSGWYRFSGLAGAQMVESCVPENRCGTRFPGWLEGTHPSLIDGVVTRDVCFHVGNNCCKRKETIRVRNCGKFYVYKLNNVTECNSRYCGAKPGKTRVNVCVCVCVCVCMCMQCSAVHVF